MLKFVKLERECRIVIFDNVSCEEIVQLKELLSEDFYLFKIHFTRIYNIPAALIELLYNHIELLNTNIEVLVNKNRLSKYLNQIGLKGLFVSKLKNKQSTNANINVLAIGGSANSSEKIIEILSGIDTTKFAIFIIQHIDAKMNSVFDEILSNYVEAKVSYAADGMDIKVGNVYLAEKDRHLRVENSKIYLDAGDLKMEPDHLSLFLLNL